MTFPGVFPFGGPSLERPPLRPATGSAHAFVLGVCPSALHVQWCPPRCLVQQAGVSERVAALAVDVVPARTADSAMTPERGAASPLDDQASCKTHVASTDPFTTPSVRPIRKPIAAPSDRSQDHTNLAVIESEQEWRE